MGVLGVSVQSVRGVSRKSQECFKDFYQKVSRVFPGGFKSVPRKF